MFLKQYRIKSSERLKGSDVKRLRQRVEKEFPSANLDRLLPATKAANVSRLRIITHSEFQTNVYCVDKLPMFFEFENEQLVPTLYTVWLEPDLLPYFTTWEAVLPKLSNGADLMLPGVTLTGTGMNMYGHYKKGQLVAVNLTSNKAAVAVGYLPRSSDDMYMSGGQGVGVKILHIFGDKLWGHEPALVQQLPVLKTAKLTGKDFPALGSESRKSTKPQDTPVQTPTKDKREDFPALGSESRKSTKPQDTPVPTPIKAIVPASTDDLPDISELEIDDSVEEDMANPSLDELTPEDILKNAFLSALKNHGKKMQLPLLTSNFFRLYVVPEADGQIDLKKTRYKKLSNFLAEMIDQGFIVVREETKGIDKITSVDLEHPELVNFITDFKQSDTTNSADQPLFHSELTEMYIVTDRTAAFFTKLNYKRGEGIPVGQVKKILREYVNKENLPILDRTTKKIRLDATLRELYEGDEATLSDLCTVITGKMEHSFQMSTAKDTTKNKPLIQMSLATRSGNKKVTLVSNIDCYGIILSEFIKLCKQGAAASTSIVKLPHQKREQLQIQGNQIRFIYLLLTETYKVPPKSILGLELAKDGKKHKKK